MTISVTLNECYKCYKLTYQPTGISAWITSSPKRQSRLPNPIEHYSTRINTTIGKHCQKSFMTYKNRLNPWCIIRPLPNMQSQIVERFRRRADAEGHLLILKRVIPANSYEIIFDTTPQHTSAVDENELHQS